MVIWSETTLKLELKGFEDGLNDARCGTIDQIAYQINREYQSGVDIAQQLMARLDVVRNQILNRLNHPPHLTQCQSQSEGSRNLQMSIKQMSKCASSGKSVCESPLPLQRVICSDHIYQFLACIVNFYEGR